MWDPGQYQQFAGERGRPFFDLLARVQATDPGYVADLGCGPGNLTVTLAERWPGAEIVGVDNSPEMISAARKLGGARARLSFVLGDLREWRPGRPVDVLVSNAVLQWVPDHLDLVRRWPRWLAPGGWLAFQLPGNLTSRATRSCAIWRGRTGGGRCSAACQLNRQAHGPAEYLDLLAAGGLRRGRVGDHLPARAARRGPGAGVVPGHGAAPGAGRAGPGPAEEFLADYRDRVREAYPPAPYGTVLPFRRVFVVARRTGS